MTEKPRVIILAGGNSTRWNNFRGTPKHLVTVEGKVLLERTVKQFLKYTDDVNVIGVDDRYKIDGASLYVVRAPNTQWKDAAKFLSSKNLWKHDGRTVLVFGDVYFTSDAVRKIMTNRDGFKFFLRSGASSFTGCEWKEIFALSFNEEYARKIGQSVLYLVSMGQVEKQAGWALYKYMIGPAPSGLFNNPHFVEIDDWTEDFDFPEDLEKWEKMRKNARKPAVSGEKESKTAENSVD